MYQWQDIKDQVLILIATDVGVVKENSDREALYYSTQLLYSESNNPGRENHPNNV